MLAERERAVARDREVDAPAVVVVGVGAGSCGPDRFGAPILELTFDEHVFVVEVLVDGTVGEFRLDRLRLANGDERVTTAVIRGARRDDEMRALVEEVPRARLLRRWRRGGGHGDGLRGVRRAGYQNGGKPQHTHHAGRDAARHSPEHFEGVVHGLRSCLP